MAELIHEHSHQMTSSEGVRYRARICGTGRADGTWAGWIEFHPASGEGEVLRTGQETSQPTRRALEYWAGGIEPIYLEGALERTRRSR